MAVKETLADLVAIDSVSARTNGPIIDYLATRCAALGLTVQCFPYHDNNGIEKTNLLAVASDSTDAHVELALVGHTDTVPYDPNWKEALSLSEREGKLFGRGACDTKAFIAAALTAIESVDLKKLRRPLALLFTADEEIGLIGAKRFAEIGALHARFAIVGEPTSLRPIRAGKGYCLAEITVKGREAHSAYPGFGTSAIKGAARLLTRLEKIAGQLETETHADFDPPFTTINVGLINGGTAKNVIAGECRFTLEWRPVPGQPAPRLLELLAAAIAEERLREPNLVFAVDAARADEGFETAANSSVVQLLQELSANEAGTVAFGTEAVQMAQLGAEAVVFGPGDIRVAHRTGEYVPVDELARCAEILAQAIERLCR